MFRHILLPLDGSALAESALPAAAYLARVFGSRITLVHIIEKDGGATVHGERHLTQPNDAKEYLLEIRQKAFSPDASVSLHVHESAMDDVASPKNKRPFSLHNKCDYKTPKSHILNI